MADLKKVFEKVIADKIRTIPDKARIIETASKDGSLLAVRGSMDYVEKVLPHCYAAKKELLSAKNSPPDSSAPSICRTTAWLTPWSTATRCARPSAGWPAS